jgi:hypothetical protein
MVLLWISDTVLFVVNLDKLPERVGKMSHLVQKRPVFEPPRCTIRMICLFTMDQISVGWHNDSTI